MRIIVCLVFLFIAGCGPVAQKHLGSVAGSCSQAETQKDVESALKTVAGAISGREVSDKDVRGLARQLKQDKEAQAALEAITQTVSGQQVVTKYCPVDGERFSARLTVCPVHGATLQEIRE
jgi:hypothetical protein